MRQWPHRRDTMTRHLDCWRMVLHRPEPRAGSTGRLLVVSMLPGHSRHATHCHCVCCHSAMVSHSIFNGSLFCRGRPFGQSKDRHVRKSDPVFLLWDTMRQLTIPPSLVSLPYLFLGSQWFSIFDSLACFLREAFLCQPPLYNYNHLDTHRDYLRTVFGIKKYCLKRVKYQ